MNSKELLMRAGLDCDIDKEITEIVRYAQDTHEHALYVDVYEDSDEYVKAALKNGALVISSKKITGCIWCDYPKRTLTELVQIFYGYPYREMTLIGVTGTCGKSTVVHLISSCLKDQGIISCSVMTGKIVMKDRVTSSRNTTPDALFLIPLMRECLDSGIRVMIMEVSSEAYQSWRTEGLYFDVMIGTVIASDHLDSHGTLEKYRSIKKKILALRKPQGVLILNVDDPLLREWQREFDGCVLTYGFTRSLFQLSDPVCAFDHSLFCFQHLPVMTSLCSMANIYNLSAALICAFVLDLNMKQALMWARNVKGCSGRFEIVSDNPLVMIDFAHTERAVREVLRFLSETSKKRIICVVGCGGNRDAGKRPLIGKAACDYAHRVILTSDNPRNEDPVQIVRDIQKGCTKEVEVELDRVKAIELALTTCTKDDIIVLLGKGDETSLFSQGEMMPYSDAQIVRRFLKEEY